MHPCQDLGNQHHEEQTTEYILADGIEGLAEEVGDGSEHEALPVGKSVPDYITIPLEQPCHEEHAKDEAEYFCTGGGFLFHNEGIVLFFNCLSNVFFQSNGNKFLEIVLKFTDRFIFKP